MSHACKDCLVWSVWRRPKVSFPHSASCGHSHVPIYLLSHFHVKFPLLVINMMTYDTLRTVTYMCHICIATSPVWLNFVHNELLQRYMWVLSAVICQSSRYTLIACQPCLCSNVRVTFTQRQCTIHFCEWLLYNAWHIFWVITQSLATILCAPSLYQYSTSG